MRKYLFIPSCVWGAAANGIPQKNGSQRKGSVLEINLINFLTFYGWQFRARFSAPLIDESKAHLQRKTGTERKTFFIKQDDAAKFFPSDFAERFRLSRFTSRLRFGAFNSPLCNHNKSLRFFKANPGIKAVENVSLRWELGLDSEVLQINSSE